MVPEPLERGRDAGTSDPFVAESIRRYLLASSTHQVAVLAAITLLSGHLAVLAVAALSIGLCILGLRLVRSGAYGTARRMCVANIFIAGLTFSLLLPGSDAEIFIASNLPATYLWYPSEAARERRIAIGLLIFEYIVVSAIITYAPPPALLPGIADIAHGVIRVIFPIDLLGIIAALLNHRDAQETALRDARDLAVAAGRLKERIMTSVAHELRSPLAATLGLLSELEENTQSSLARRTITEVERVLERTTDLLDLARLESGQPIGDRPGAVRLMGPIIRAVVADIAPEAQLELDPRLERGYRFDTPTLRRVLGHLLHNARTHGGGQIEVRGELDDGAIYLTVRDHGPGFSQGMSTDLFAPFSGDLGVDDAAAGCGVGLPLSRALARAAGGDLVVRHLDAGACLIFRLPVTPGRAAPPAKVPPLNLEVLIVEDEKLNRVIATRVLGNLGCQVHTAEDGLEAVKFLSNDAHSIDFVLMDVRMPNMDGLTATRVLKRNPSCPPIVALTANALAGDRERCLAAGMDEFLSKPLHVEELLAVLGTLELQARDDLVVPAEA